MNFLHAIIIFAVSLSTTYFAQCQHNASKSRCVLVTLPTGIVNDEVLDILRETTKENVTLIGVYSEPEHELVVDFVEREFKCDFRKNCTCSDMIGVIGDLDSTTASIIDTLASRSNLNITLVAAVAPSTFLPVTNLALPHVLDMNPLVHYIEALVSFTDQLNWTRIGLISDGSHYHELAAELFQRKLSTRSVIPYVRLSESINITCALQMIMECGTRVTFISMDRASTCFLLEEARKMNLLWPNYAWILLDYDHLRFTCNLDGVLKLKQVSGIDNTLTSSEICRTRNETLMLSVLCAYTKVLHDSISAAVQADRVDGMDISNMSFTGATGLIKFRNGRRLTIISVVQVVNNRELEFFSYDPEFKNLTTVSNILALGNGPRGSQLIIYDTLSSRLRITLVVIIFTLCLVFISTILFLFIIFRKEQEIKATSFAVSLCMFLGCYLLLLQTPALLIVSRSERAPKVFFPEKITCNIIAWLSILGISPSLILATLFVKMLRVYAIFVDPLSYKKKFYSNYALLLYIGLIVSPNALVLLLWSTIDPLNSHEIEIQTKSKIVIIENCLSNHTLFWLAILVLYMLALILAVVVVAFKTSTIRYKHFQDAKATNAFAFLAISLIIITTFYYGFFIRVEASLNSLNAILTILYTGHFLFVVLCQVILFVPKVFPPLKRWLFRNHVKSKKEVVTVSCPQLLYS